MTVPGHTFVLANNTYKLQEAYVNDDMIVEEKLTLMKEDFVMHPYIIGEAMLETVFTCLCSLTR